MDLNLITEQRLKELDSRIVALELMLEQRQLEYDPENILLDNSDFMKWLRISRRTAQSWRDDQYISFIQIDSKVYYTLADVKRFLEKHRKNARRMTPEEGKSTNEKCILKVEIDASEEMEKLGKEEDEKTF